MGRPRASLAGLIQVTLIGSLLLLARRAAAAPELSASIAWQGDCDDRGSLHAEIEARGAELVEVAPGANISSLSVFVQKTPENMLRADVLLATPGASERRQVEARECEGLRRALAWVLWVLAEERQAAERKSQPSTVQFPTPSSVATPALPLAEALPPDVPAPATRRRPTASQRSTPPKPCARPGPRFGLGAELVLGFGMVDSITLGPALVGTYRPCARYLPGFVFGASRLQSVGYELDGRAISLERTSGQVGVWFELLGPMLRAGLTFEAGRLRASGSNSADGRGATSRAPWLALVAPLRVSVPLLSRALSAEAGLAAAYTPQAFELRYASGQRLASPNHFELRGSLGLAGHF